MKIKSAGVWYDAKAELFTQHVLKLRAVTPKALLTVFVDLRETFPDHVQIEDATELAHWRSEARVHALCGTFKVDAWEYIVHGRTWDSVPYDVQRIAKQFLRAIAPLRPIHRETDEISLNTPWGGAHYVQPRYLLVIRDQPTVESSVEGTELIVEDGES